MTDIHSHILPDIDDGAQDTNQFEQMARLAASNGIKRMAATPHFNSLTARSANYRQLVLQRLSMAREMLKQLNIPLELCCGMEVLADEELGAYIDEGRLFTLNGSRYLLIEFPFYGDPSRIMRSINEVRKRALVPVIAHPERYRFVQEYPDMVYDWLRAGALMQVNRSSFFGRHGEGAQEAVHYLVENGLVCAVASDCHSPRSRTPELRSAAEYLSHTFSPKLSRLLVYENPNRILNNMEAITAPR